MTSIPPPKKPPTPAAAKKAAPVIGRYEVGVKIADGGMAEVFLARLMSKSGLGGSRFFALKVLRPELSRNTEYVNMFLDEGELHRQISHPGTVQIFESGVDRGRYFIAMELLTGSALVDVWEDCQRHRARMQPDLVAWIGARVAETLGFAHSLVDDDGNSRKVVHRDINPANIFLTFDGRTKVIDFGLVKADHRRTETDAGIVKGKLAYLSPEQVEGEEPDHRTDVFALGVTLWELATDRRLFKCDDDLDTVRAVKQCVVPDPRKYAPYLPVRFARVLLKALAKHPDDRFSSATEFSGELDSIAREADPEIGPPVIAELLHDICEWGRREPR